MTNNYVVRQAVLEDLDALANLFNLYRIFYGQPSAPDQARHFLLNRMEQQESVIFIVKDTLSERTVGFTQLYPVFSSISMMRSFILNDLYVQEEYRNRGIAQLLLDEAKQYAKRMGAKGLELSTAADNEWARRLYVRNGYVKDEQFLHYYLTIGESESI